MIIIMLPQLNLLLDRLPGGELEFAAGAAVFHRGDAIGLVHVMLAGVVHLVRHQDDGAALILQRAHAGAILAEASVYSQRYHCDARAETASTTRAIPRSYLRRALVNDPKFAETWARHLAYEVQRARLQTEILSLKTVAARLSAWMVWNGDLPRRGLWTNIANEISVSPEALYREIARRRNAGRASQS